MKRAFRVSDHAVVRYSERVHGVDLDPIRDEIARKVKDGVEKGANAVVIDGFRYVIEDGVVVTVTEANRPCKRTGMVRDKRRERDDD